ncbi:MAG TPA: peptidase M75, Imelysin [Rhizobiales bacterium]|nr:peptidase M75, Imelysin [Hyphomicrobiales bacterium]
MNVRLALSLAAWLAMPAAHAAQAADRVVTAAIEGYVRPAYAEFEARSGELAGAVGQLCSAPSPAALDGVRREFGRTVSAWSRIELLHLGPVTEANRLERVLFWPDRKGTGLKQVQAALANEDPTAVDPATLAGKSVAMQGLGALEFVLFGPDAETLAATAGYRCAYAAAIAKNVAGIAEAIEEEWQRPGGYADKWSNPGEANPFFHDETEARNELLGVIVEGLEMVHDQRLGFLGETAGEDKPKQALFWRSGLTVENIAGGLAGLSRLFEASGIPDMLPTGQAWIAESIRFEFANAAHAADRADGPVDEALKDPARRNALSYLRIVTRSLSDLFGTKLAAELGLTAGFSSLDGD